MSEDLAVPIYFIGTGQQDLSPFSAHEVDIDGVIYKTAEHAYQALRVVPEAREKIISTKSPILAWSEGQRCKNLKQLIPDCDKDVLMEKVLRAKLSQHADIRELLIATGNRELIKKTETDYYWAVGADGTGENRMGKLWMKLRAELK